MGGSKQGRVGRSAESPVKSPAKSPAKSPVRSPVRSPMESPVGSPVTGDAPPGGGPSLDMRNEVVLVGRMAAAAEERTLPSGDLLTTWRLVVDRPPARRPVPPGVRAATVDTLNCVAWEAGPRRTARGLVAGDVVSIAGALRRRFWRAGAGAVSRCEVEVSAVKRLSRAAR